MASPQTEKGFTRIANELMAALSRSNLNGVEYDIILTVIAKTYGWNKKQDKISLSQFSQITKRERSNCARAIRNLLKRKILGSVKGDTRNATTYYIQKDYDKWLMNTPSVKNDLVSKMTQKQCQIDTTPSVKHDTTPSVTPIIITKYNLKDNLKDTKDIPKAGCVFDYESEFEKRWVKYPNKDGKKQALRHFKALVKNDIDLLNIDKAMVNYLASEKVKRGFIKDGSTWFYNWSVSYTHLTLPTKRIV